MDSINILEKLTSTEQNKIKEENNEKDPNSNNRFNYIDSANLLLSDFL